MRISAHGVHFIAGFEGFVGHPYRDAAGVWTIGYGHTHGVTSRSKPITRIQAMHLLEEDLDREYAPMVQHAMEEYHPKLHQDQFDALTSFCYNLGGGYFGRGHTMGDALHSRDHRKIADAFLAYDRAGGHVLPGLLRRRQAERHLFLS